MSMGVFVFVLVAILVVVIIAKTATVVPQQNAFVVERLGKYKQTLEAGFYILLPFLDVIRYRHSLKERAVDIAEQICITRDNVQVGVDGVLYLKVMDPKRASYGVGDYLFAISQLAQTDSSQRDRQDRPGSDVRRKNLDQHPGRQRGGQGV